MGRVYVFGISKFNGSGHVCFDYDFVTVVGLCVLNNDSRSLNSFKYTLVKHWLQQDIKYNGNLHFQELGVEVIYLFVS